MWADVTVLERVRERLRDVRLCPLYEKGAAGHDGKYKQDCSGCGGSNRCPHPGEAGHENKLKKNCTGCCFGESEKEFAEAHNARCLFAVRLANLSKSLLVASALPQSQTRTDAMAALFTDDDNFPREYADQIAVTNDIARRLYEDTVAFERKDRAGGSGFFKKRADWVAAQLLNKTLPRVYTYLASAHKLQPLSTCNVRRTKAEIVVHRAACDEAGVDRDGDGDGGGDGYEEAGVGKGRYEGKAGWDGAGGGGGETG